MTQASSDIDTNPMWGHWIAGERRGSIDGGTFVSTSPADGSDVAVVAKGTARDVDAAVNAAVSAQVGWAALSPTERSRHLQDLAIALRDNVEEFNRWECAETGKIDARAEITYAADYFEMYAGMIRALRGEVIDIGGSAHAFTRREPWGVVGIITPWNGPLNQAIREVAPAIVTGNTVVVKPAEDTSLTSLLFGRIAQEAGLPDGVYNAVAGYGADAGTALVKHPGVRKIAFTGSVETGRRVAALAADRLIPATLELGGKSPHIIFDDADLDAAAPVAATAFTGNTGQVCSAGTRLLVHRSVHAEFVERVRAIVAELRPGRDLGPLITTKQRETVERYFGVAREDGATLVAGGSFSDDPELASGNYVFPTIYTDVTPQMRIAQEEIFGPVLAVIPFEDEEEAVRIANDSDFGLVSGLWTSDVARALRVAAKLQSGNVYVNGWGAPLDVPFGGYKSSGYGREKGFEALQDFTQLKSVVIHGL